MNWRKTNRWLHRQLGFLFFGMAIIYGISGIALNHSVAKHWNPALVQKAYTIADIDPVSQDEADKAYVIKILERAGERKNYKQHYFPAPGALMIYLKGGHILVDLEKGTADVTKVRKRNFFTEINFLHYNKPKQLWTWFSDIFGLSMVLLAISGIIMVKGKKGLRGSGGILLAIGIIIPLVFLVLYLWS